MDRFFNKKVAMQSARILVGVFLVIHASFIVYFHVYDVDPMRNLNVLSVMVCLFSFWVIKQEEMDWFIGIVGMDVMIHMTFCIYFVGGECGLQRIMLGMPMVFFYTDYFSLKLRGKAAHGTIYSVIYMLCYVVLEFADQLHTPIYQLPDWLNFYTRVIAVIVAFAVPIVLAYVLTRYSYMMERRLRKLAQTDALTGRINRYGMKDVLWSVVSDPKTEGGWVALLELDNYLRIRETCGREAADQILISVAECLEEEMGDDFCARWEVDQFLLHGGMENERLRLEKLLGKIRDLKINGLPEDVGLVVSVGASRYEQGMKLEEILKDAEHKLHMAKYNGSDQVVV